MPIVFIDSEIQITYGAGYFREALREDVLKMQVDFRRNAAKESYVNY